MKTALRALAACSTAALLATAALAGPTAKKEALVTPGECPIMNAKVSESTKLSTTVNGQKVLFCCAGCPDEFAKNPAKYVKAIYDPVTGRKFQLTPKSPHSTYKGGPWYFADKKSKAEFDKNPKKYAKT